jgi:hypothetical protein
MSAAALLVLVFLLAGIGILLVRRPTARPKLSGGPRIRHPVTRIICAVLGLAILGLLAIGSRRDSGGDRFLIAKEQRVQVPVDSTLPTVEPTGFSRNRTVAVDRVVLRLLVAVDGEDALLAQCWRRRGLAFAGTLAALLLVAATAERLSLGARLARAADAVAPPALRALALIDLDSAFFYRHTARDGAAALAADPTLPTTLRRIAAATAARLER